MRTKKYYNVLVINDVPLWGLYKRFFPRPVQWEIDYDYISDLIKRYENSPEGSERHQLGDALVFLHEFNSAYYGNDNRSGILPDEIFKDRISAYRFNYRDVSARDSLGTNVLSIEDLRDTFVKSGSFRIKEDQ